jgi:FixJ family two-component response regulator
VNKVRFLFKGYGLYVNYGVGREITALRKRWSEGDDLEKRRKDKRWYSSVIYREVHVLSRILADKYSKESARTIASRIMGMEQTRRNVVFNTNNFKRS